MHEYDLYSIVISHVQTLTTILKPTDHKYSFLDIFFIVVISLRKDEGLNMYFMGAVYDTILTQVTHQHFKNMDIRAKNQLIKRKK